MNKRMLALGRLPAGEKNKTEERYAQFLEAQRLAGKVLHYWFEPVALRLAKRTSYTPDFMVMTQDGHIEFHEVKGFWRDDAKVMRR